MDVWLPLSVCSLHGPLQLKRREMCVSFCARSLPLSIANLLLSLGEREKRRKKEKEKKRKNRHALATLSPPPESSFIFPFAKAHASCPLFILGKKKKTQEIQRRLLIVVPSVSSCSDGREKGMRHGMGPKHWNMAFQRHAHYTRAIIPREEERVWGRGKQFVLAPSQKKKYNKLK